MNDKFLIILEGPAGVGKTYIASQFAEKGIPVVSSSLSKLTGKRSYPNDDLIGVAKSAMMNDMGKLFDAVAYLNNHDVVVMDRLILSQIVYHVLRGGDYENGIINLRPMLDEMLHVATSWVFNSTSDKPFEDLIPMFLLIESDETPKWRLLSEREYPHDYRTEMSLYEACLGSLSKDLIGTKYINASGEPFPVQEFIQDISDGVIDSVKMIGEPNGHK